MKQDQQKKLDIVSITEKIKNLVLIEWRDPTWHSDKNVFDTDFEFVKQTTAGLLIKETKKYIRVALNIDDDGFGEYIDIPKSIITGLWIYPISQQVKKRILK